MALASGYCKFEARRKIAIDGFYDGVEAPSERAKSLARKMNFSPAELSDKYQLAYPFLQGDDLDAIKEATYLNQA
ncbi:hypothetical protein [Secundilactobacillus odoratitofui]|uniref:hypothetical protein n=1 Tax=Secundilactobacillus odoratitofui TaxID=480930 RepID=UPI000ABC973D|nr:hypothetical protein [Secundilactobacillus odoratitofui]